MSIITGVAEEALVDFGDDFEDGSLTVPGSRTPDGQGGFTTGPATIYHCKALVGSYKDTRRVALGIPATDRRVLVLAASLPAGICPAKGHKIAAPDPAKGLLMTTFDVIERTGDLAGALAELQAR
jgi:hypothetical protein